jgi:DNA-binding NarL/FixJ family response regulator
MGPEKEERMQVVLAVQQRDLGLALQLYLDAEPGLFVVGTATEAASLRALLWTASPDLVILEWDLPGYAPVQLLAEIKRPGPSPQIIVLGSDEGMRQEALAAGADAFALSGDLPDDLWAAIRQSHARHRADTGTPQAVEDSGTSGQGPAAAALRGGPPQSAASGQVFEGTEES